MKREKLILRFYSEEKPEVEVNAYNIGDGLFISKEKFYEWALNEYPESGGVLKLNDSVDVHTCRGFWVCNFKRGRYPNRLGLKEIEEIILRENKGVNWNITPNYARKHPNKFIKAKERILKQSIKYAYR